jgi:hypothetical protein
LVIASVAYWEGVRFRISIVQVAPPRGFCLLDKTNRTDVEYLDGIIDTALASLKMIYSDFAAANGMTN